jgi:hypothetical protein
MQVTYIWEPSKISHSIAYNSGDRAEVHVVIVNREDSPCEFVVESREAKACIHTV